MTFRQFANSLIVSFYVNSDWVLECSGGNKYNDYTLTDAATNWNIKHNRMLFDIDSSKNPSEFEVNDDFIKFLDSLEIDVDFDILIDGMSDILKELDIAKDENLKLHKEIQALKLAQSQDVPTQNSLKEQSQYHTISDSSNVSVIITTKKPKSLF